MSKAEQHRSDDSEALEWVASAVGNAAKSAMFCVAGRMPGVDPEIEIAELGAVKFPLKPGAAKKLIACCQTAPYGKGTKTLVDTKVRKTWELSPKAFRLGAAWNSAVAEVTRSIAEKLGLPADRLTPKLYKLLVYEKGGFFLPHRDSEKHDRMVASLIVVLPNHFEGGALVVRHGGVEQTMTFQEAAGGQTPSYAAFYADCEHEVRRVLRGLRLCLTYNLVLAPKSKNASTSATPSDATENLAQSLGAWVAQQPDKPLVFALEHHYTERGLSLDLLKGADRRLSDLVVAAASRADCRVYLSQVTRHLSQWADDGSFGDGYSRYGRPAVRHAIEIGETYEDELLGSEWTDVDGTKQPWGAIPFAPAAIVASTPLDEWKPTSETFEGYTGNAGNTLDRLYQRSALAVWHRDHHFEIVASCGIPHCMPLFAAMIAKLAKTPKARLEAARTDAMRFARESSPVGRRDTVPTTRYPLIKKQATLFSPRICWRSMIRTRSRCTCGNWPRLIVSWI